MEPTRYDGAPDDPGMRGADPRRRGAGRRGSGRAGGHGRGGSDGPRMRFYAFRAGGGAGAGEPGIKDGGPLRRMIGGLSAAMVLLWTLLWLAFYGLIELLGSFLVWLSRSVLSNEDLAAFVAGVFDFLQDLGFATIFVIWLVGVILVIGFNLVTHRATRDAEARWTEQHGNRARPVGGDPVPPHGADAAPPGSDIRTGPGPRPGAGARHRPVTIDLRRDGDTYR